MRNKTASSKTVKLLGVTLKKDRYMRGLKKSFITLFELVMFDFNARLSKIIVFLIKPLSLFSPSSF